MKFTELQASNINLYNTDKCGESPLWDSHLFGEYYDDTFQDIKDNKLNILEIGIQFGGSVRLLHDYFQNSEIHCIDIHDRWNNADIMDYPRLHRHYFNAYDIDNTISRLGTTFDIIIDDGPHTLESQIYFIENMGKLLNDGGILILEDVPVSKIDLLTSLIKTEYKVFNWYDINKRFDDVIIEIKK